VKISRISKISKINTPLLIIAIVSIFAFVATKAFYTTTEKSEDRVFVTGTLDLSITSDDILTVANWRPGDINALDLDVQNTGTLPVLVKGRLDGSWDESGLDSNMLEISSIDMIVNGISYKIAQGEIHIGDEFYFSPDGTIAGLFDINSGDVVTLNIATKLSDTTPDEYQNKTFTASLHIAGKQSVGGSDWPATY
jgi:hypothetical protein